MSQNPAAVALVRLAKQQAVWTGAGVTFRTVRHIKQWDGRTVGLVRNTLGIEYVVQHVPAKGRWDALDISTTEIWAEGEGPR